MNIITSSIQFLGWGKLNKELASKQMTNGYHYIQGFLVSGTLNNDLQYLGDWYEYNKHDISKNVEAPSSKWSSYCPLLPWAFSPMQMPEEEAQHYQSAGACVWYCQQIDSYLGSPTFIKM